MTKMKLRFLRLSLAVVAAFMFVTTIVACRNGANVVTNGDLKYKAGDLNPKPFTEIELDAVADVYYKQTDGNKHDVRLDFSQIEDEKVAQQFREKTKVVYRDGKVIIGIAGKIVGANGLDKGKRLRVYITSPDLLKVTVEGVGSFFADAINSDTFDIDNEGVGSVSIKNLLVNNLKVDNEGVGNVLLGKLQADRVFVDNEGVGNVKITDFKGGKLSIDNEGVGNVDAHVDCESVSATLEGVGSIRLSGVTHHFTKDKDGVGSIKVSDLNITK